MPSSPAPALCSCSRPFLFLAPPSLPASSSRLPFMHRPSPLHHVPFLSLPVLAPRSSRSFHSPTICLQAVQELPPKLAHIVQLFQLVPEPRAKYQQLLHYGKNLKPLPKEVQTRENKVQGCVSQVWVRASIDKEKMVYFEAESDSLLTKGLAALLVEGLSGSPASEILLISPDFIQMLGLNQSLTPSRSNGFLNMLKLMQKKALELSMESEGFSIATASGPGDQALGVADSNSVQMEETETAAHGETKAMEEPTLRTRQQSIREKLESALDPVVLEVEDVSYQHAGHAGVQRGASETHFNVKVVSPKFEGRTLVKRHRLIYDLLQDELQNGLHALSIVAKTPAEAERI